ncbi:MAG: metal-dependent hydrolase, partial [Nocardioides sp.]|nr:metal-dependent hydrolase [Nocardioides sp.]
AGSALLPDIDCPTSTVARSFGIASVAASHVVDTAAAGVYNLTKGPKDEPRTSGHRTLTHTALFTVTLGFLVAILAASVGKYAVIGTLFITVGLAIRGLMADWAKREGWLATTAAALAAAVLAWVTLPQDNYWWLGLAVGLGASMHLLGDMITKNGCPILAPFSFRGRRWWELTLPSLLRIRAGGWFEWTLLLPAVTAVAVIGAMQVYTPGLFTDLVGL